MGALSPPWGTQVGKSARSNATIHQPQRAYQCCRPADTLTDIYEATLERLLDLQCFTLIWPALSGKTPTAQTPIETGPVFNCATVMNQARQGYLNLLLSAAQEQQQPGDTSHASACPTRRFLEGGHYQHGERDQNQSGCSLDRHPLQLHALGMRRKAIYTCPPAAALSECAIARAEISAKGRYPQGLPP